MNEMLNTHEGAILIQIARHALETYVISHEQQKPDLAHLPESLHRPGSSFVTLRTLVGELRGCLGNTEAREPLAWDVAHNSIAVASRDPRFEPIAHWELASLRLEVSVLTTPRPVTFNDYQGLLTQLRPGIDGVILSWQGRRGLLLPQVWGRVPDPAGFLHQICLKAHIPRHELQNRPPTLTAQTFQVQYFAEEGYIEMVET